MHKYFEGFTVTGGALLVVSFFFAIFFRFYDLGVQSPWTDELATWFYSGNLDQVFLYETHSPLYYFLVRLFVGASAPVENIRYFSATLSCLNLLLLFLVGLRFMDRPKLTLFLILLAFSPADIIHSRMARHYGLLLEGTLLFLFLIKANGRTWILSLLACFMGLLHVFFLVPMFFILLFDYLEKRNLKKTLIIFISSLGILIYYLIRRFLPGYHGVIGNLQWNDADFLDFARNTVLQFTGLAFPHSQFFPLSLTPAICILVLGFAYLLYRKNKSGLLFAFILFGGILFVELLNLYWINLRISRIMIYLPGLFIFALSDAVPKPNEKHFIAAYVLSLGLLYPLNVFTTYDGDNEFIKEWRSYTLNEEDTAKLICFNKFQAAYYKIEAPVLCSLGYTRVDFKKPLIFMDINGNDRAVLMLLTQNMIAVDYKKLNHSLIIRFEPR